MTSRSERGSILIQVAVGLVALTAFSALALDMGALWVARSQAQAMADAGAMAGAISRAYDDLNDPPLANGLAYNAAVSTAQHNTIWGVTTPTAAIAVSWTRPAGTPAYIQGKFARVDVYRNGTNGSTALPTFFLQLVGRNSQGVKATATAAAAVANVTSNCLRPWMIPDQWAETNGTAPTTWDAFSYYTPPDPVTGLGTGYQVPRDIGHVVTLHPGSPKGAIAPSDYFDVDLSATGKSAYRDAIEGCTLGTHLGATLTVEPGAAGGGNGGPTDQGVTNLYQQDPNAKYDPSTKTVIDSAFPVSPRLVPIALFSPAAFAALPRQSGRYTLTVVNVLGFFVQSPNGSDITGVLVSTAGELNPTGVQVGPGASFLQKIVLVR